MRVKIFGYACQSPSTSGGAPAAQMLSAFTRMMEKLKLPVNMQKTRCLRCPDEALEFLGYRIGTNYRPNGKGAYIGTRPSRSRQELISLSTHKEILFIYRG